MLSARPVEGPFRTLRWWADAVLVAILLLVPWIRIGGEPLILLDIPARKFHVFGLVIFPQELYFLWLLVIGLALALFFFTALAGRLWCGWACPQTVFTDLFAAIARRLQRWKGTRPPPRVALWRKIATHVVWLAISAIVGFHLIGYFVSPYTLIADLRAGILHPTALLFHVAAGLAAYLDFAFVKQTFCKALCPYARFQGVLFDRDTLVIGYDTHRGEPRGKAAKRPRSDSETLGLAGSEVRWGKASATAAGDCVDCRLCVAVCPADIDIRKGMQLECIACTQCIDACNGVMQRLGRARNLIGYRSLVSLQGKREAWLLRPRVAIYGVMMLVVGVAFTALLARRMPMDLQVMRSGAGLYATAADGRVTNTFTLHIQNRGREGRQFQIRLDDGTPYELLAGMNPILVPGSSNAETRVFVLADAASAASREIHFVLEPDDGSGGRIVRRARFVAPGGNGAH
jgi:cytochrome c oxidase accessory protein FixG